jgi:hypothetical protein
MKKAKFTLALVIALLVATNLVVELLTNYATASVPAILVQYPYLTWVALGVAVVALFALTLSQRAIESSQSRRVHSSTLSVVDSGGSLSSEYDVFISYSHEDYDWVHTVLVPRLEAHGFSVFTDSDFKAGAFGPDQMQYGVEYSKRVIAVFTPQYFASDWAKLENTMTQLLDPAARDRRLIPVMRRDCEVPLRLRGIHYRDLRTDDEAEWGKLVEDLM